MYSNDNIINQTGSPILDAEDSDHVRVMTFSQSGTAVAGTYPIGVLLGSATLKYASICLVVANQSGATVTVDFKKNGTTVLSSTIQLDDADAARHVEEGTISVPTGADGDVYEAVVTVNAGGGTLGEGLLGQLVFDEDYASS